MEWLVGAIGAEVEKFVGGAREGSLGRKGKEGEYDEFWSGGEE